MPLTLKDVQCFLLKKPCLQLLPALPKHPRVGGNFVQDGLQPPVKFLGKISAGDHGSFQEWGKRKK